MNLYAYLLKQMRRYEARLRKSSVRSSARRSRYHTALGLAALAFLFFVATLGHNYKLVQERLIVYAQTAQVEASKSATLEDQNQALEKKLMGEVVPLAPQNIQDLSKFYIKKYFTEP